MISPIILCGASYRFEKVLFEQSVYYLINVTKKSRWGFAAGQITIQSV